MYRLIYDYVGENDTCRGITEDYDTFQEAQQAKEELKQCPDYCNFSTVSLDME